MRQLSDDIVEVMRSKVETATLRRNAIVNFFGRFSFYCLFVIILALVAEASSIGFGSTALTLKQSVDYALVSNNYVVDGDLRTFQSLGLRDDWWAWAEGPLLDVMFPELDYNDSPLDALDQKQILHNNRLIGSLRIRQIRVEPEGCDEERRAGDLSTGQCFPNYNRNIESKAPFGPGGKWTHSSESALRGIPERGYRAYYTYPGSGFVVDIPAGNRTHAADVIRDLRENYFIDLQTRAVFVEYSVFNPHVGYFLTGNVLMEVFATSRVFTSTRSVPMRLTRYFKWEAGGTPETIDRLVLAGEAYVLLSAVMFVLDEIAEVIRVFNRYHKSHPRHRIKGGLYLFYRHLTEGWNLFDYIGLGLLFSVLGVRAHAWTVMNDVLRDQALDASAFVNLGRIRELQEYNNELLGAAVLLYVLKTVKYMSLLPVLGPFVMAIVYTVTDTRVFMFMFIFLLMILAFALGYNIGFGYQLETFDRYGFFINVFKIVFGEFGDLEKTHQFKWYIAPLYWMLILLVMALVMLNIFIALIAYAYSENLDNANKSYKKWENYVLSMQSRTLRARVLSIIAPAVARYIYKDPHDQLVQNHWSPPFWGPSVLRKYKERSQSSNMAASSVAASMIDQLQQRIRELEATAENSRDIRE